MATRSAIAIPVQTDGERTSWKAIYCHYDGYPSHQLPLLEKYDTPEKREALFALGNLSSLGDSPETCIAYSRDRGEDGEANLPETGLTLRSVLSGFGVDYCYWWDATEQTWVYRRA